jgi:Flp pilus assembly pilin Flp
MNTTQRLVRDNRGLAFSEYIILVGVVALLCVGAFQMFGGKVKSTIETQGNSVGAINATAGGQ